MGVAACLRWGVILLLTVHLGFSVEDNYILGAKDELNIYVYSEIDGYLENVYPAQKIKETISLNGYIELPTIGLVQSAGLTIKELKIKIESKYAKIIPSPTVVISLIKAKSIPIYVIGEVKAPGMYYVNDADTSAKKILHLIQKAGGFTEIANKRNITIKRNNINTVINLIDPTQAYHLSQNVLLQNNDTVIVHGAVNKVYILGEVKQSGAYAYNEGAKVMDYIAQAGGITDDGGGEIGVITFAKGEGDLHRIQVDQQLRLPITNLQVTPGTIIFVPKGFFGNWEFLLRQLQNLRDTFYYPNDISTQLRNQDN